MMGKNGSQFFSSIGTLAASGKKMGYQTPVGNTDTRNDRWQQPKPNTPFFSPSSLLLISQSNDKTISVRQK
jgi:hypothetical protein